MLVIICITGHGMYQKLCGLKSGRENHWDPRRAPGSGLFLISLWWPTFSLSAAPQPACQVEQDHPRTPGCFYHSSLWPLSFHSKSCLLGWEITLTSRSNEETWIISWNQGCWQPPPVALRMHGSYVETKNGLVIRVVLHTNDKENKQQQSRCCWNCSLIEAILLGWNNTLKVSSTSDSVHSTK